MLHKNSFINWLRSKGYSPVPDQTDTFEKGDVRYTAFQQSLGKRVRYSTNRWSSMETSRYNRRFINREGKLDYIR